MEGGLAVRVHNGHVRQGWILLINSTGYIVPSLVDIPCALPPHPFVHSWRCSSSSEPRSSTFHSLLFQHQRESGILLSGWVVSPSTSRWCPSLLYHSHYARLRQRRYRSDLSYVPFYSSLSTGMGTYNTRTNRAKDTMKRKRETGQHRKRAWDDYWCSRFARRCWLDRR